MYYVLSTNSFIPAEESNKLKFLYNTFFGRIILKIFTTKLVANLARIYFDSRLSKIRIKNFIKKNNINMDEYEVAKYSSFNDFFKRNIKKEARPIAKDGLFSICDSKLTVYKINKNSAFNIKNSIYTVDELIGESRKYKYALVFRLCVDDYHHYVFPDNGKIVGSKVIDGTLHTVQPIALKRYKVFHENQREVTFLDCENLGDVCIIEVGAMVVGKIVNEPVKEFKKAQEKGHFEFGGSTVIMLITKDIKFIDEIIRNSEDDIETIVKLGEKLSK